MFVGPSLWVQMYSSDFLLNSLVTIWIGRVLMYWGVPSADAQRLAQLGELGETDGIPVVVSALSGGVQLLLASPGAPSRNVAYAPLGTSQHGRAVDFESQVASSIGVHGASQYAILHIGGTGESPNCASTIHVNYDPEDLLFTALGPRVLIDGAVLPFRDASFERAEGHHIPLDMNLTPGLLREVYRVLQPGGRLIVSPSTDWLPLEREIVAAGFVINGRLGRARRSWYRNSLTRPAFEYEALRL